MFIDVNRLSLIQLLKIKLVVPPTLVYKWLFLPLFVTLFLPTKAPHIDVIVPYFVYSEDRSWRKQRVHALQRD